MLSFLFGPEYGPNQTSIPLSVFDIQVTSIDGQNISLAKFTGKKILITTLTLQGIYSYQLADIQKFYDKYRQAVEIIGIPLDPIDWNQQNEVQNLFNQYTQTNKCNFSILHKTELKGAKAHPLILWLEQKKYNKLQDVHIRHAYQKFVLSEKGSLLHTFDTETDMFDNEMVLTVLKESPNLQQARVDFRRTEITPKSFLPMVLNTNKSVLQVAPWN